jgi:hypothetical protein
VDDCFVAYIAAPIQVGRIITRHANEVVACQARRVLEASKNDPVPREMILVAMYHTVDEHCLYPQIGIYVVVVVVVVTSIIALEAVGAVDEEVVMRVEVVGPVVVIHVFLWRVVVDEEIVVYLTHGHDERGRPGAHGGEKRLPVPRIERPVITTLAARGEDEVSCDLVAPSEAIVEIDAGPRSIEKDVSDQP